MSKGDKLAKRVASPAPPLRISFRPNKLEEFCRRRPEMRPLRVERRRRPSGPHRARLWICFGASSPPPSSFFISNTKRDARGTAAIGATCCRPTPPDCRLRPKLSRMQAAAVMNESRRTARSAAGRARRRIDRASCASEHAAGRYRTATGAGHQMARAGATRSRPPGRLEDDFVRV
jgi:hypothetical protein